jgi:hypothetical protein
MLAEAKIVVAGKIAVTTLTAHQPAARTLFQRLARTEGLSLPTFA